METTPDPRATCTRTATVERGQGVPQHSKGGNAGGCVSGLSFAATRVGQWLETTHAYGACGHPDHPHPGQFLIRRRCGTMAETEDERVTAATAQGGQYLGSELDQHIFELTGVCKPCQG